MLGTERAWAAGQAEGLPAGRGEARREEAQALPQGMGPAP